MDGEIPAINQMYLNSLKAKDQGMAMSWARAGAFASDEELTRVYIAMFKASTPEDQSIEKRIIQKNQSSVGAKRLAAMLGS